MSDASAGGGVGGGLGFGPSLNTLPPPPGSFAAPPQKEESTCPSHQTWLEGAEAAALACSARGRPSPQVRCSREGTPRTQRLHVSREDAGVYRCLATNTHGTDARIVTVGVECE